MNPKLSLFYRSALSFSLCSMPFLLATGYPLSLHPFNPPSRGRTRETPFCFKCNAARALEASFGQAQ